MSHLKKSDFSATCNRLNQCVREKKKKSFPEVELLNMNTVLSQEPTQDSDATLDLFPVSGTELNKTCTTKPGMKQLTILYNGSEVVKIDNIKAEKAEELIAFASSITTSKKVELDFSMPMARRTSLQRFLQKRKDRINSYAPYSSKQASYDDKSWLQLGL